MAETLFLFDVSVCVCMCVCVCVCVCVHSRPVNQTSLKQLKLQTLNLTCLFPGTVWRTWLHKNLLKGDVASVTWPPNFWELMLVAPKQLKLQTSYLTCMFSGTVQTFFGKWHLAWPRYSLSRAPSSFDCMHWWEISAIYCTYWVWT